MSRRAPVVLLTFALAALAAWRAACILTGPDIDTDAYAHHMIARAILADPSDLAVHWVWLPLFHYIQVPLVALGGTMDHIRWANLALTAALPIAVFRYVRRTTTSGASATRADVTALLAAVISGACPIAMQMGTTAQPEPLFAILVFCTAVAFAEGRYVVVSATLGAAVLLRYEAWACLAVISVFVASDWRSPERRDGRAWLAVLVPAAAIASWAVLRRPVDGRWFGFFSQPGSLPMAPLVTSPCAIGGRGGWLRTSSTTLCSCRFGSWGPCFRSRPSASLEPYASRARASCSFLERA